MARRVVLTSFGSYGDLHPFIATGLALKAEGFDVLVAASEDYREKVARAGLAFHPAGPSFERISADTGLDIGQMAETFARTGTGFLLEKAVLPYVEETYAQACEALQGADLVVGSSFTIAARLAIAKLGLPSVTLLLSPITLFSAEEPPYAREAPWLQGLRRLLGAGAVRAVYGLAQARMGKTMAPVTALRRRLGLPPLAGGEVMAGSLSADWVAALYSPLFAPLPPDAPANCTAAGFAFYDSESGEEAGLSQPLQAFLDAGAPPLVFTLGSWAVYGAGDFYAQAAEAAARLGRRAVLLVGRYADDALAGLASKDVFVAGYEPHSLVFPRAAAVIHHGGVGTVGQALRAGRPQLVCPMFGDQFDNAQRLVRLGVAGWLDHRRFTAESGARALKALLGRPEAAERAAAIAVEVRQEDGAAVVARRIAEMLDALSHRP